MPSYDGNHIIIFDKMLEHVRADIAAARHLHSNAETSGDVRHNFAVARTYEGIFISIADIIAKIMVI
jgi:hypothetical protein